LHNKIQIDDTFNIIKDADESVG